MSRPDSLVARGAASPVVPAAGSPACLLLRALPDGAPVVVSACLLGEACRYDGGSCEDPLVRELTARLRVVPVCPERAAGLPVPRTPAELRADGRVLSRDGADLTEAFGRGAASCLKGALSCGACLALLKSRSPSCGVGEVYDGTFSGRLVAGRGVFARALARHGVLMTDERELARARALGEL